MTEQPSQEKKIPRRTARVKSDSFDYSLDFKKINFRQHPELYEIGRGEQGVLLVEPYKSEILPHWRFADIEKAEQSSQKIYQLFLDYLKQQDFVGADMARKFLQMGYTRARRYANHKGGKNIRGLCLVTKKVLVALMAGRHYHAILRIQLKLRQHVFLKRNGIWQNSMNYI